MLESQNIPLCLGMYECCTNFHSKNQMAHVDVAVALSKQSNTANTSQHNGV